MLVGGNQNFKILPSRKDYHIDSLGKFLCACEYRSTLAVESHGVLYILFVAEMVSQKNCGVAQT